MAAIFTRRRSPSAGLNDGDGYGSGADSFFVTIGGTPLGAEVFPMDTPTTIAQRLVDAINATFVGVCAAPTATAGEFTVTSLSPINGFTMTVSTSPGASGTISMTGDANAGNEGTWSVDASQSSPLNRAFVDYLTDFAGLVQAAGQTMTVAFSQELLGPPDANTAAGAWSQRFADGSQVLTDTGFGSWGAGFVEALSSGVYQQTGHGYITGNTAHFANATQSGTWTPVVVDANHYTLGTELANSGGYTPGVGDSVLIDLQTTQCNFNPATTTAYLIACYKQAAGILSSAGLTPWLQLGEMGWWFYSRVNGLAIGYASWQSPISVGTTEPHGLSTGQGVIDAGVQGNTGANGDFTITVTDSTHFTLNGSSGNGNYVAGTGTVSGGGMAFYDPYTLSGRALGNWYTQDDDPSAGSYGDTNYLRGLLYAHMHAISAAVKAAYPGAKIEWLLPMDTNHPTVYWNNGYPYPQGGRLNNYINIPAQYQAPNSDIDRVKIEALSWGLSYLNLDLAAAAIAYATSTLTYPLSATAYLIPWSAGVCAWAPQYLAAVNAGVPLLGFWAVDHLTLLSWPVPPLPANPTGASVY